MKFHMENRLQPNVDLALQKIQIFSKWKLQFLWMDDERATYEDRCENNILSRNRYISFNFSSTEKIFQ